MLANTERMQRMATAEDKAKQAREDLQKLSKEKETLQAKLEAMNKQVSRFEEWHKLLVDDAQQIPSSEASADASKEKTIRIDREKHVHLKKNFLLLTERVLQIETSNQQLLEKLEDRDKQIKKLQTKVGDTSILPNVSMYEPPCMNSGEETELVEVLSHDATLAEIKKHRATILKLRNHVASLESQVSTFEKTAAEHSKLEKHGKEQSKAVMEWRQRCEVAEVMIDSLVTMTLR